MSPAAVISAATVVVITGFGLTETDAPPPGTAAVPAVVADVAANAAGAATVARSEARSAAVRPVLVTFFQILKFKSSKESGLTLSD